MESNGVKVGQSFKVQFLELNNKSTTLCRIQDLEKHLGCISSESSSSHPGVLPRNLEKAEVAAKKEAATAKVARKAVEKAEAARKATLIRNWGMKLHSRQRRG